MPWTIPYEIGTRYPEFEVPAGALNGYEIAECRLVINGPVLEAGEEEIVLLPPVKLVVVARHAMKFDVRREDGRPSLPIEGLLFRHCKGVARQYDFDVIFYAPWNVREAATRLLPDIYGVALAEIANGLARVGKRLSAMADAADAAAARTATVKLNADMAVARVTFDRVLKPGPRRIHKP